MDVRFMRDNMQPIRRQPTMVQSVVSGLSQDYASSAKYQDVLHCAGFLDRRLTKRACAMIEYTEIDNKSRPLVSSRSTQSHLHAGVSRPAI